MEWVRWKKGYSKVKEPKTKEAVKEWAKSKPGDIISRLLQNEATPGDESEDVPPINREEKRSPKRRSPRTLFRRFFKQQKRWRPKAVTLVAAAAVASSSKAVRVVDVQLRQGQGDTSMAFRGMFLPDFTADIKASSSGEGTSRAVDAKWAEGLDEECPFVAVGFNHQPLDTHVQMLKKEGDSGSERVIDPGLRVELGGGGTGQ